ncbi:MAG: hypothetical protein R3Y56_02030 [Akkermansia sp.]
MKLLTTFALLAMSSSLALAQMPSSFDASGQSAKNGGESSSSNPNDATQEPANPQLMGMEMPLLDPSSDTVKYNGGHFDVGNNALVRARFEKYLQQMPDNSEEARRYRHYMNGIMDETRKSSQSKALVSSDTLVRIGRGLFRIADYPLDGGQADALASSMISVLDAQRANLSRDRKNESLEKDIDKLVMESNRRTNTNASRASSASKSEGGGSSQPRNTVLLARNTKEIAEFEAEQKKNDATNAAAIGFSKITYQAMLLNMLMQRRFDHCVIGSRVYRHLFTDGDTRLKMNKNSKASKFFSDVSGMPPTVNTMDSLASNARHDVDQSMEAVSNLLAQNRLGAATQHLIEAVAIGEFMQSVTTFPTESRQRIATYWNLRKRVLSALNARDYGTCEEIAKQMKSLDSDFDDSLVMTYCAGRKRQSDFFIRSAKKALEAGDDAKFNEEITKAATIWPRNPNLDKGVEELAKLDSYDPIKAEFKVLVERKAYRTIADEQDRFDVVAIDPTLKEQYKEIITLVGTMDAILDQLDKVASQDKRMGPCVAYETLLEKEAEEPRFAEDPKYKTAIAEYSSLANDFVSALRDAEDCEGRREMGSALSNYYRAMTIYPKSNIATKGADRVRGIIMAATY